MKKILDKKEINSEIPERIAIKELPKKNFQSLLRVGIAGAGLMGKHHARAAEKAGGKIVGIVELDSQNAENFLSKFPRAKNFTNITELLKHQTLDVLHVCTPTNTHKVITESAINAGVNVFIEKPITQTAAETIYLYDLAVKNNVQMCPTHQFAFQTGIEKAKRLLPQIGQIIHLQSTICSAGGVKYNPADFHSLAADILPHPLSLFQTILNTLLTENDWQVWRPKNGELRIFNVHQEISLSIFISLNARPTLNSLQIFGTNGTIHIDLFHGFAFLEIGKVSKIRKILHPFNFSVKHFTTATFNLMARTIRRETAYPGLVPLVRKFYQAMREGTELPITPEQSINVARVRDFLIYRSDTH